MVGSNLSSLPDTDREVLGFPCDSNNLGAVANIEPGLDALGPGAQNLLALSDDISEEEEIEIGAGLISGLLGAAPLVDDPALQRYVTDYGTEWGHFAAGAVLVSLPVIALFFALQRHFVEGLTAGAVKG